MPDRVGVVAVAPHSRLELRHPDPLDHLWGAVPLVVLDLNQPSIVVVLVLGVLKPLKVRIEFRRS